MKAYSAFHDANHLVIGDGTGTMVQHDGVDRVTSSAITSDLTLRYHEARDVHWITLVNPPAPLSISWSGSCNTSTLDVLSTRACWLPYGDDPDRIRSP